MDDSGHRENGRHKVDPYKTAQGQWMMQHTPSMKQVMAIMAERDAALNERNLVVAEKKAALAERDMAYLQRDAAIAERNNALSERDNAVAALQYRDNNATSSSQCPPGCQISRAVKHMHHPTHLMISDHHDPISSQQHCEPAPRQRGKQAAKEPKPPGSKRVMRRVKTEECVSLSVSELIGDDLGPGSGSGSRSSEDWKGQEMGLNQVAYDETTMPAPVCSCTGTVRQCYKWGNGGWQSSCCTTTMSLYPLPAVPNKRHARVGGRKMSGSAFNKLLSRLAAEGHDLSNQVDLKDNWAKHGTNRYITIK